MAVVGENIRDDAPPPLELLEGGSDDFGASVHTLLDDLGIGKGSLKDKILAVETVTTASRRFIDLPPWCAISAKAYRAPLEV